MDTLRGALARMMTELAALFPEIVAASVMFLISLTLGYALAGGLRRMVRPGGQAGGRYVRLVSRTIQGVFGLVGLILGLQILGLTAVATSLLATGGLMAVVLGFAFKEIGENLLAGIFLGVSRSFEVGDLIESSGHVGKVRDIDLRQVWIRSADGRDIFIPSAQIFRNVLVNYTRDGLRRGEFTVGIDYADPAWDARRLLLEEAKKVGDVLTEPAPSVRISDFTADYCELQVFFWVDTEKGPGLSDVRSSVMASCLRALRDGGYTLSSDVSTAVTVSQAGEDGAA